MVTPQSVEAQLKKVHFNQLGWGRTEARELPNILIPDEEIFEVVNGIYEGGFALVVATNIRLLLIDKKPLNYLTIEDMRFDMINEIDYSHRLFGAQISISAGSKNLKFRSYNQARLRKLIGHVQHCMAEAKKQQSGTQVDQSQHLEKINQQLQVYLIAQHQQQQELHKKLAESQATNATAIVQPEPVKPSPELADYLYAQSLLAQERANTHSNVIPAPSPIYDAALAAVQEQPIEVAQPVAPAPSPASPHLSDLYAEGMKEIFGKHQQRLASPGATDNTAATPSKPLDINPLTIAYSKLPMALRNRKFGRPSFHAHSEAVDSKAAQSAPAGVQ